MERICDLLRLRRREEKTFGSSPYSGDESCSDDVDTLDTEQSYYEEEKETLAEQSGGLLVYGKNKHKWYLKPPKIGDQLSDNTVRWSCPKNDAAKASSPLEMWSLLFMNEMIDMIARTRKYKVE